jgi:plasmid maintenance system killer protein
MVVDRRSIAKMLAEVRPHRFEHLRKNRRGGIVIEVNAAHDLYSICFRFDTLPFDTLKSLPPDKKPPLAAL